MYFSLSGPLPVTIISTFGSFPFAFLALFSYRWSASRRMEKSSSGVHEVLETSSAGRSGRWVGLGSREGVAMCVNGVECGGSEAGRNPASAGTVSEDCRRKKSCARKLIIYRRLKRKQSYFVHLGWFCPMEMSRWSVMQHNLLSPGAEYLHQLPTKSILEDTHCKSHSSTKLSRIAFVTNKWA